MNYLKIKRNAPDWSNNFYHNKLKTIEDWRNAIATRVFFLEKNNTLIIGNKRNQILTDIVTGKLILPPCSYTELQDKETLPKLDEPITDLLIRDAALITRLTNSDYRLRDLYLEDLDEMFENDDLKSNVDQAILQRNHIDHNMANSSFEEAFKLNEHQIELPQCFLSVNLGCEDKEIINSFKVWLKSKRMHESSANITLKQHISSWKFHRILLCYDLQVWYESLGIDIDDSTLFEIIFQDGDPRTFKLPTVNKLVKSTINLNTLSLLIKASRKE